MRERTIDAARWARLSLLEQLANIGSEVGRTFSARGRDEDERYWSAFQRALDLFEATVVVNRAVPCPRLKEVARAKHEFLRIATDRPFAPQEAMLLEAYFTQCAVASRSS